MSAAAIGTFKPPETDRRKVPMNNEIGLADGSATSAASDGYAPKLKFTGSDRFIRELRRRVDAYFEKTGRRKRDCPQMYFKTASILAWFFGAYALLVFVGMSWWLV